MAETSFNLPDPMWCATTPIITEISDVTVRGLNVPEPESLRGTDFWPRIVRLVDQLMSLSTSADVFTDLGKLFYLPDAPTGTGTPLGKARAGIDTWLRQTLEVGRTNGAVRADLPHGLQTRLTLAVLSAMDEWSVHHIDELDVEHRGALANKQLDALRRLLEP